MRGKIDTTTVSLAAKDVQISELTEEVTAMRSEHDTKANEVTRALTQVDAFQSEIESLTKENTQLKGQIADLKL